jgi:hypothetical protein
VKCFISNKIVKIVQISKPKGARFEDEERDGCAIARMWLVLDYSGRTRSTSYAFATSLLFTLSYRYACIHTPYLPHTASRVEKISCIKEPSNISPLHSYSVLTINYKEF